MLIDHTFRRTMKILVFDTETTGLNPTEDHIVEFGCVIFNEHGENIYEYNDLVNTKIRMDKSVVAIHGISNAMLTERGRKWSFVSKKVEEMLDDADVWCGHNLEFDINFVRNGLENVGIQMPHKPTIDTLAIARRYVPEAVLRKKSLGELCKWLKVPLEQAHRACDDARATGNLLFKLSEELDISIYEMLESDSPMMGKFLWGSDPFIGQFLGNRKDFR